jgi:acid phosphatase type 7
LPILKLAALSALLAIFAGCGGGGGGSSDDGGSNGSVDPGTSPVVVAAAGDIACEADDEAFAGGEGTATECRQKATSDLVAEMDPDAVLALGDLQYQDGENFEQAYGPTWGRFKDITYPTPGNHEYQTSRAEPYFDYFGEAAGEIGKGYYGFDLGQWHVISLNGNCPAAGGCEEGSEQEVWLRQELRRSAARCTLAFWHQPRFSSGVHGDYPVFDAIWRDLYDDGVDVVVNAHDHNYERFFPQNPDEERDDTRGITEFVVGSGGKSLRDFPVAKPTTAVKDNTAFGVLKLSLYPESYEWEFVPVPGSSFKDSGTADCH